ncbi:MAG: molybdenum ABC transporter ATP-binding protein [Candidatus Nitrospinota bacterium M3_3B_026]
MTIEARFRIEREGFTLDAGLSVPETGVTVLFGPSGSGKTTFLRAIAGLERAIEGYLAVGGDVWQEGGRFTPPHRRSVGYVFQEPSLFPHLTTRGNLEYALKRTPPGGRRVAFGEVVELLGISSLLDKRPRELSGGQRQRVAIGRALLSSPRLMLFDEPLASLDHESRKKILPYIGAVRDALGAPAIYVTHSLGEAARVADNIAVMEKGAISRSGPVEQMLTSLDSPLVRQDDAMAVLETVVRGVDGEFDLVRLAFSGGELVMPMAKAPREGSVVRVLVSATDVSLSLDIPGRVSALNILEARITGIDTGGAPTAMVRLDAGGAHLLAKITRRSREALGLRTGMKVFAHVKSVALTL